MIPVNRAGSVTEMKLVSVHMATFSPLSEIPVGKTEISATEPARSLIWTRRDFFKGIKGCAEISETGPARSTGLIWRGPNLKVLGHHVMLGYFIDHSGSYSSVIRLALLDSKFEHNIFE